MKKGIVRPLILIVILVISFSVFGCAIGVRDPYPDYYGYPYYGPYPYYPHFYETPRHGDHEHEEHGDHEHEEHRR